MQLQKLLQNSKQLGIKLEFHFQSVVGDSKSDYLQYIAFMFTAKLKK